MKKSEVFRFERLRLQRMAYFANCGDSIADIGFSQCPNPFLTAKTVFGIDPNASESDRVGGYSDVFSGTLAEYLEVRGQEKFNSILAGELIEHLESPVDFLRECFEALQPGGRIVISTPNPNSLIEQILTLTLSRRYFYTEEHVMLIPQRWLIRIMEIAGFSKVKLYSGGFPVPFFGLIPFPRPWCYQTIAVGEKTIASFN